MFHLIPVVTAYDGFHIRHADIAQLQGVSIKNLIEGMFLVEAFVYYN